MALGAKLELRQSQSLVMTPQLQQAIKLLQFSHADLQAFVEQELERNPLLERGEEDATSGGAQDPATAAQQGAAASQDGDGDAAADADFADAPDVAEIAIGDGAQDFAHTRELDVELDSVYPEAGVASANDFHDSGLGQAAFQGLRTASGGSFDDEERNLEHYLSQQTSLKDHVLAQLSIAALSPAQRLVGAELVEMLDEAGYLRGDLHQLATRLGTSHDVVEQVLQVLQGFEPAGLFARSLQECLALQLRDRNRYDPMIATVLENLELLAARRFADLKRLSGAGEEDLADIIAEITRLDPKPGLRFEHVDVQPVIPDVLVTRRADGSWHVELNSETLPKVLIDRRYFATVSRAAKSDVDKAYLNECMQTANWLVKSLDQRARTILKVSQEIVRQQDGFFAHGVQHLRPLNLKTVADAIAMHESTVSRVTSNKYIGTERGIFEMKYFFTSAISASGNGDALSSEAVRHRIRQLIDAEPANKVLSDDKIVSHLQSEGIDIARRTVAKYREAMRIPSSVQRRRQKKMALRASA